MCKYKKEGICNVSEKMCKEISPTACVFIIEAYEKGYNKGYNIGKQENKNDNK